MERNIKSTNDGAVSFAVSGGACTIEDGALVITSGTGECLVTATKAADANYTEAISPTVTVTIAKAVPEITWDNPAAITQGSALSSTQLNARANVAGTFTYTPSAGTKMNTAGSNTLQVEFTPTDGVNCTTASKTVQITVNPVVYTNCNGGAPVILQPINADGSSIFKR